MKILAIDTSAKITTVAITDDNKILSEFNIDTNLTHSQALMPMINSAIKCAGLTINEIDGFAVAVGPGSFTGLRIGIGAVKGLSYALKKPCVAVSTIQALAYNLSGFNGIICPVMDARCNQVYTAIFESNGHEIKRLTEDMAITIDELGSILEKYQKCIFLVGDGADLCYNKLELIIAPLPQNPEQSRLCIADVGKKFQRAAMVGLCSINNFKSGNTISSDALMPVYLRLPQAERERLAKSN